MRAKVKTSGEIIDGRLWEETNHFKPWPPDERVFAIDEVDIINN